MPNILSKGTLNSRSVNVPLSLYGLNEEAETGTPASEEPPSWSCSMEDGARTLVLSLSVPRLVRPFFPTGSARKCYMLITG